MGSSLGPCAQIFRIIFIVVNAIFIALACVLLGVGIYLQVESQSYSFVTGSEFVSGAGILIACGIVTGIIAAIGFVGACLKWRPLLIAYAIILFLIVILEIISAIIGFVYYDNAEEISGERYREGWEDAITDYRFSQDGDDFNEDANDAVDFLQDVLDCCGIDGPDDWGKLNPDYIWDNSGELPESCECDDDDEEDCRTTTFQYTYNNISRLYMSNETVWTRGCYNRTIDLVAAFAIVYGGVGLAFGIFEVIGIIVAIGLCCCITRSKDKEYV